MHLNECYGQSQNTVSDQTLVHKDDTRYLNYRDNVIQTSKPDHQLSFEKDIALVALDYENTMIKDVVEGMRSSQVILTQTRDLLINEATAINRNILKTHQEIINLRVDVTNLYHTVVGVTQVKIDLQAAIGNLKKKLDIVRRGNNKKHYKSTAIKRSIKRKRSSCKDNDVDNARETKVRNCN